MMVLFVITVLITVDNDDDGKFNWCQKKKKLINQNNEWPGCALFTGSSL